MAISLLDNLLGDWKKLLTDWAGSGTLTRAASEALLLKAEPALLKKLVAQWSHGDFSGLPPIVLLPASSMPGAAGAYAISTGTIYLNQDWLATASDEWVLAVLTEELGHHLDGLLNCSDTPGDEGELFAALLQSDGVISAEQRQRLLTENDQGSVQVEGQALAVENAEIAPDAHYWARVFTDTDTTYDYTSDFIAGIGSGTVSYMLGSTSARTNGILTYQRNYRLLSFREADGALLSSLPINNNNGTKLITAFQSLVDGSYAMGYMLYSNYYSYSTRIDILSPDLSLVRSVAISSATPSSIIQAADGSIYVAGSVSQDLLGQRFNGGFDMWGDSFILRISSSGIVDWVKLYGGSRGEATKGLFLAGNGDIALIGETNGTFAGLSYSETRRNFFALINPLDGSIKSISAGNDAFVTSMSENSLDGEIPYIDQSDGNNASYISNGYPLLYSKIGGFLSRYGIAIEGQSFVSGGILRDLADPSIHRPFVLSSTTPTITISTSEAAPSIAVSQSSVSDFFPNSYTTAAKLEYLAGTYWTPLVDLSINGQTNLDYNALTNAHARYIRASYDYLSIAGEAGWLRSAPMFLPPQITLSVSPVSVTEDGIPSLVYTFTRTGATTNALSINYTVAGTATLGSDYVGIAASPATKTVTIAAGSATATVNVDPTADTSIESDETVALTLAAGSGYTIGTTTAVIGTITNDDFPVITLAVSPATVPEDGTANLIYTFSRTGPTTSALTFNYGITGTADAADYTGATPGAGKTISFAAGSATSTLTIDPTADTTIEVDETIALTLAAGTGYTLGTATTVTGSITNDDFPVITLAVAPAAVTEDGTANLIYTFSRTGPTTSALTVNYGITGTADASDYTGATPGAGKTISFAAGSATATLTINPTADTTIEADESVALTLTTGTGYTLGTATAVVGTITNDDFSVITLAVAPAAVTEDGTANFIYTFSRTGPTNSALIVNYSIAGTADASDYTGATPGASKTISFATGSAIAILTIDPTADTTIEVDETIALTLAAGTGYTLGTATAVVGTITNDDFPVITLAVTPAAVTEDGTANLIYTFSRTGPTTSALTVNYSIAGTADASDYSGATAGTGKTISFATGSATATLTIDPTADSTIEADETVALTLAAGMGYTLGTATAEVGTITNDDFPVITLAVAPAAVTEDGTANLIYTFSRTGPTTSALTVNYGITGTADATDYTGILSTGTGKTISFAAGSGTATLTIDPTADTTIEADESVALTLAAGTGYTLGTATAVVGTITNDDFPVITLAVAPAAVTEDGASNIIYTLTRTGPTTSALTVNYAIAGTADATDYSGATPGTSKTISFAAGSATATLTIDPTADSIIEPNETVALTLAAGTGYTLGTATAVVGTITNDDFNSSPTALNISATSFAENIVAGSTVASLSTTDPDAGNTFTYALVAGIGSTDNTAFTISGNQLKINVSPDFEAKLSYSIRVRSTDQGGLFFERNLVLAVNNLVEKVTASASTILAADKDTLELTGARNIFGMGNRSNNWITGNSGRNKLTGGLGKDVLAGTGGVDTFFYGSLKESLLSGFDVITDYAAGEKIGLAFNFEGDDLIASAGSINALSATQISTLLTTATFIANNAEAFTVQSMSGTFVALNDAVAGFQAGNDALIHLSNYTIGVSNPVSII